MEEDRYFCSKLSVYPRFSYRWINVPVGVEHSSEEKERGHISQEEHVEKTRSYGWRRNPFHPFREERRRERGEK